MSSLVREIFAGMAATIALVIALVFLMHTMRTYELWKHNGYWKQVWPPLSVTLFMLGSVIFNGALWLSRHLYNQDFDTENYDLVFVWLTSIGLAIKIIAGIGMVHQFTFKGFGRYIWVYAIIACIAMWLYCYISYTSRWGV